MYWILFVQGDNADISTAIEEIMLEYKMVAMELNLCLTEANDGE